MRICRGPWNTEFLDELAAFPSGGHDDQVDALSGANEHLAQNQVVSIPAPISVGIGHGWHIPGEIDWRDLRA